MMTLTLFYTKGTKKLAMAKRGEIQRRILARSFDLIEVLKKFGVN